MSVWGGLHKAVREGRGPRCAKCGSLLEVEKDDTKGVTFPPGKVYQVAGKLYCLVCVYRGLIKLGN